MRRVALVVTDRRVLPPRSGNRMRILGLLRGLRALGWRVALISSDVEDREALGEEVDRLYVLRAPGFLSGDVDDFDFRPFRVATERVVRALRPALVVAEYAWLAPAIRRVPTSVLRVVDCHDVLHERTRRFSAAGLDPWVQCTRTQERRLLRCADVLLSIQDRETAVLEELLPQKRVRCLLPHVDLPTDFRLESSTSMNVLAVGAMHAGNEGIRRFAVDVWPGFVRTCAGARLQVVGSIGRDMPPTPGVDWVGEVEDLSEHYRSAAVVLCPMEIGTGIKIKMLEALRRGKAVVAMPAAAEGLPAPSRPTWMIAHSLAECAEAVRSLLASDQQRTAMEREAFAYGEKHLSLSRFLDDLKAIVPGPFSRLLRAMIPTV